VTAPAAHPPYEPALDLVWSPPAPVPVWLPVGVLSKAEKAAALARLQEQRAALAAYEAELILGLAADTPADTDPPPDTPGARRPGWAAGENELPGVSEFFTAELAVVLNCGRGTATHRAQRAWTWAESLPATLDALRTGRLDERRAAVLADVLQHTNPAIAQAVEARLLAEANELSLRRLRERATALMVELDAAAADRRRARAKRAADVHLQPSAGDGMAELSAELPAEEAAAAYDLLDQLAKMRKQDGDPRPIGQLRAVVFSELLRRPWEPGAGVLARLEITATLDTLEGTNAAAGAVNGQPITATHLRELLHRVDALGLRTPPGGSLAFTLTDPDGTQRAILTAAELARLAARGCPDHPDGQCACPLLGVPPSTDAYGPTDRQRMFVRTRDRRCRFPNCGQRTGWADLDHVIPHACAGPTACENLCCLCRSHHRLKTFAPGWHFRMDPDGTLHVTTPSGITRTTRPPGLRPPPAESEPEPDPAVSESPHGEPEDEPPF
jgi:hypothetical protein